MAQYQVHMPVEPIIITMAYVYQLKDLLSTSQTLLKIKFQIPATFGSLDPVNSPVQESSIMTHEQDGTSEGLQPALKPFQGLDIEVVGWLIER